MSSSAPALSPAPWIKPCEISWTRTQNASKPMKVIWGALEAIANLGKFLANNLVIRPLNAFAGCCCISRRRQADPVPSPAHSDTGSAAVFVASPANSTPGSTSPAERKMPSAGGQPAFAFPHTMPGVGSSSATSVQDVTVDDITPAFPQGFQPWGSLTVDSGSVFNGAFPSLAAIPSHPHQMPSAPSVPSMFAGLNFPSQMQPVATTFQIPPALVIPGDTQLGVVSDPTLIPSPTGSIASGFGAGAVHADDQPGDANRLTPSSNTASFVGSDDVEAVANDQQDETQSVKSDVNPDLVAATEDTTVPPDDLVLMFTAADADGAGSSSQSPRLGELPVVELDDSANKGGAGGPNEVPSLDRLQSVSLDDEDTSSSEPSQNSTKTLADLEVVDF
ncbi:MAG: hypothetical protein JSS32_04825 [Verrucomicrobia bacterium]|nr:hypothetical protein [Verrucomicrobiota bacterium]